MIFILNNFIKQNKKTLIITGVIITLVIIIIIIKIIDNNKSSEQVLTSDSLIVENNKQDIINEETLIIHITGAVVNEGIIQIPVGSRIADAIEKAGGLKDNADLNRVNLAYQLEDGQKLYIPSVNDQTTDDYIDDGVSEDIIVDLYNNSNMEIININKADINQLQTLSGIGESTATAIIQYREENGSFESIEDIKNVPGIGESKYEVLKDKIKVK